MNGKEQTEGVGFDFILQQRKKFREIPLSLGDGRNLTLLRPQESDPLMRLQAEHSVAFCARHIVGWSGFKESHFIPGAGGDPVAFHAALMNDLLADDATLLGKVMEALKGAMDARSAQKETAKGNSPST